MYNLSLIVFMYNLAIGSEYFVEIGKFRAFNSLLHEIAKKYGVKDFKHALTAKTVHLE